ncbi:MAG: (d)CMP kinase [Actinobacteria bacterium]|nr:MAG: (d)CMP kinase [Actinomycetota bacterium]
MVVIAIDGPGGVGKSTVARRVAAALRLPYLDTGATYRAATLAVLRAGASIDDEAAVIAVVYQAAIGFDDTTVWLDGDDVSAAVRTPEVTATVSMVSAYHGVRGRVVAMQRAWVAEHGGKAVVEGRDIGSVVFPDADVKVFLTADPGVRAERRSGDAEAAGKDIERVAADLAARDRADATREASPLVAAAGAVVIDTSELTIDEVVARVLALVPGR